MSWWEPVPVAPPVTAYGVVYATGEVAEDQNSINLYPPMFLQASVSVISPYEVATAQGEIWIELITQTYFRDHLKQYIPSEYWRMDARPTSEGGGGGALNEFTQVFAITLDEIKQAVDDFTKIFDIENCPPKYLPIIADMINFPLEATDTTAEQRRQLRTAVEWYKSKGSRRAFRAILYAFGFYTEIVPLWTEHTDESTILDEDGNPQTNLYERFYETIPGVATGNDPPNDFPLLVENGGTWFRSPHYGIKLLGIIGDRHVSINWGTMTPGELNVFDETISSEPNGVITDFTGTLDYIPVIPGSVSMDTYVVGLPEVITDDGLGVLSGDDVFGDPITGTIDYDTGEWTLSFTTAPTTSTIICDYTYDFYELVDQIGLHRAFYDRVDQLSTAGALLQYYFPIEAFNYLFRRIEFLRPVFVVLEWLSLAIEMQESYDVPEGENPVIIVNPVRKDKGWYLGYCDLDDITYTRLDEKLLGSSMLTLPSPLDPLVGPGVHPVVGELVGTYNPVNETVSTEPDGIILSFSGQLDYPVFAGSVEMTATVGVPETITDDGAGNLTGAGITGTIVYNTGEWTLDFVTAPTGTIDAEYRRTVMSGALGNYWIFPDTVSLEFTVSAAPYTIEDDTEGVLNRNSQEVTGLINYVNGDWVVTFDGAFVPDDGSSVWAAYSYATEIPPTDRSGALPRGSTELPFPHLRDPQEGYCHPPEDLLVTVGAILPDPYRLALTRDGMNLYPPAGPVPYIDHADFPSRGFTDMLGDPRHANTFTREFGYSDRPLSLLRVEVNPVPSAENWENQETEWENWVGPWENIGD